MSNSEDYFEMLEQAREALDEEELAEILERGTDGEYDEDAVTELLEVVAKEILAVSGSAIHHAWDQDESLMGDHVGDAADQRYPPPKGGGPVSADREWP